MKKRNYLLGGVMALTIGLLAWGNQASAKIVNGTTNYGLKYTYATTADFVEVTGYTGTGKNLSIPAKIAGKPVTDIRVADNKYIETLSIPASVVTITGTTRTNKGDLDNVFPGCPNLKSYTVNGSNKMFKSVGGFLYSKDGKILQSVPQGYVGTATILKGITTVEPAAFIGCKKVSNIQVQAGNTKYVSLAGVLLNKSKDTLVAYPIGNEATFYTTPAGVKKIEKGAFAYSPYLTTITTKSVKEIGSFGMACCPKLRQVNMANGINIINEYSFCYDTALTTINFPEGLGEVKDYAFYGCSSLKSLTLPKTLFQISENAFVYKNLDTLVAKTAAVNVEGKIKFKSPMNLTAHKSNPFYKAWKKGGNKGKLSALSSPCYVAFKKSARIKTKKSVVKGKGKANTKWYKKKKKTLYIKTPDQLAGIDVLLRKGISFEGKKIVLKKNLDLKKYKNWRPIGFQDSKYNADFMGTFDGNGKTIYNLTCIRPQSDTVGLFAMIGEEAVVKNLKLKGVSVQGRHYAGGLAGSSEGMMKKVSVWGNVSAMTRVAGISGFTEKTEDAKALSCVNYCKVTGVANVGGLIGYCNTGEKGAMSKSKNKGKVTGKYNVGSKSGFMDLG